MISVIPRIRFHNRKHTEFHKNAKAAQNYRGLYTKVTFLWTYPVNPLR